MKAKVIKPFRDKYTKVIYQKGKELEVTNERFEEINSAALGPFVDQINLPDPTKDKKTKSKK